MKILRVLGDWSEVEFGSDYDSPGWIKNAHLTVGSKRVCEAWAGEIHLVVEAPGIQLRNVGFLPFAASLAATPTEGSLLLPDGRTVELPRKFYRSRRDSMEVGEALWRVERFCNGPPYENGGNTRDAMSGAGLIFLFFRVLGDSPRDPQAQLEFGKEIPQDDANAGDVIFVPRFSELPPQPGILRDPESFLWASPESGVEVRRLQDMGNREPLKFRRFR